MNKTRAVAFWSVGLVSIAAAAPLHAQEVGPRSFDIAATELSKAVQQLRSMGLNVIVAPNASGTVRTVKGTMTAREALDAMLEGTSLEAMWSGNAVTIRPRTGAGDGRNIGTVRVAGAAGAAQSVAARGVNGSSDTTATEGSRTYGVDRTAVGGKLPTDLRQTTQSITAVTRQRMDDQQMTTLSDVLKWTPGITSLQLGNGSQLTPNFYSRGFEIRNFQIDGGAPINYGSGTDYASSMRPVFDMSKYDHVEVLRGADGVNSGVGDPGGVLSLQRKRPTAESGVNLEASAGSWSARRASVDASQSITEDGSVRVRGVVTHDARDYFFKYADRQLDMAYLNVELNPSPDTRVNLGGSYTDQSATPFSSGLPRFADGSDMKLPRSTFLGLPYATSKTKERELFAQAEHRISTDWTLNVNLLSSRQTSRSISGSVTPFSGVDPATGLATGEVFVSRNSTRSAQTTADAFITGKFDALGLRHSLVAGVSYQLQDDKSNPRPGDGTYRYPDAPIDIVGFNPGDYALPDPSEFTADGTVVPVRKRTQYAAYTSLEVQAMENLRIGASLRYNWYSTKQSSITSVEDQTFAQNLVFKENRFLPPKLSISYDASKTTTLYASHAGIYNTNAQKLKADGSTLPPETGRTFEVGLKRSDFDGKLTSSLALFDTRQNNVAQDDLSVPPTGDPGTGISCCYFNSGKRSSKGVEFETMGSINPRWQVGLGYTFNTIRFTAPELPPNSFLTQAPKHLIKGFMSYRPAAALLQGKLTVGGGVRAQSKATTNGFDDAGLPVTTIQGGYYVLDAFARWAFTPATSLQLNAANLMDRTYYASIGSISGQSFYGEPFNVSIVLRTRF